MLCLDELQIIRYNNNDFFAVGRLIIYDGRLCAVQYCYRNNDQAADYTTDNRDLYVFPQNPGGFTDPMHNIIVLFFIVNLRVLQV